MTSEWLGEIFEVDFEDMCGGEIPLIAMGVWGQACADMDWEPPHRLERILNTF